MSSSRISWAKGLGLGAMVALLPLALGHEARSRDVIAIGLVVPGMNQTELQSVMGPPDYIQVKALRQAWQYCPARSFMNFLNDVLQQERPPDLYTTVWFEDGRVTHMRSYPSRVMGECLDFLAAFRWEDDIGGGMYEVDVGGRRIK